MRDEEEIYYNRISNNNGQSTGKNLKMAIIDWMYLVYQQLNVDDKAVYFMAVSILHRFTSTIPNHINGRDMHLIGTTALFIASKYFMVEAIPLHDIVTIVQRKFLEDEILNAES
jgi:uncharacterized protein (UPF0248 family)